ncbi:MAG: O-antigen ligase family protein [Bacteroidetes bacterium]|nr:O-antigen ligase family protein [Bacteroidota bacterium]
MREILYIDDTPGNKISYYLLLAFLVMLPFDRVYSELALIGLFLHTLVENWPMRWGVGGAAGRGRVFSFRWVGWLVSCLFLVVLIGSLYAPSWRDAERHMEKQLALVLFPWIAWNSRLDWNRVKWPLLKAFALSCFFTVVFLYESAIAAAPSLGALFTPGYLNHAFTAPIDLHATYFAMDVAVALVVVVCVGIAARSLWLKLAYGLMALLFLLALVQLASRAVCLAVLVIVNVLPWLLLKGRLRLVAIGGYLLLSLLLVVLVIRNQTLYTRYLVSLKQDMMGVTGREEDPEPRMARWKCAWELIRDSPWAGYGTGSEVPRLKERYYAHQLTISYTHDLNAHNQFISYVLNIGLPGGLLYLGVLVAGGLVAYRRRDVLSGSFLVVVAAVSFSENILDTNKGIFFFSVFFCLFFYPVVGLVKAPAAGTVVTGAPAAGGAAAFNYPSI